MEFRVLGPVEVWSAGERIDAGHVKQQAVLAVLLLDLGKIVPIDVLIDRVWGDCPPASVRNNLYAYVARLRAAIARAGDNAVSLSRRPGGYLLQADPDQVDLHAFRRRIRLAAVAAEQHAAGLFDEALGLWRGPALAGLTSPWLASMRDTLEQQRIAAVLDRGDIALRQGQHAELASTLAELAVARPTDERLIGQLMLALYRTGQQADALRLFEQTRRHLDEELGADPGPELKTLHQQILRAEPALAGPVLAARRELPVPRQLPARVQHFAGRVKELAALTQMLDRAVIGEPGTVVISAIGGTAGVGKSALALHWAHQVASRFGDGQLYVNLRGFDPSGTPAAAAEAIRDFLDALGVPSERIPASPEAQAGLYRSLLAEARMLIVLDNARDELQVRPLLPASPASMVIVTSRNQLSGLVTADGARLLTLDVLTHPEAVQLLTARLGASRAAAEPDAVDEIADLCACLPLALAVAAARAAARPMFTLAALAGDLADAGGRLDALDAGDPGSSVRAVFSWSTRQLTSEAARMFRLLGIYPGPDISLPAAASLGGHSQPRARALMRELARAHLIAEHVPGRFVSHDLLRAYAAEQARDTHSDSDRREATGRLLDHYLHTAACGAYLLDPAKEPVVLVPPRAGAAPGRPADYSQAVAWFEAERHVLLAAVNLAAGSGFDSHAWQLPWAAEPFLQARGHWQEWAATQRTALAAATRLGDTAGQALSSRLLANAFTCLGDHDQARSQYASSLALYQRLGNGLGEAKIHQNLGVLDVRQGRNADALGHAEQALHLYQTAGEKAGEAYALNNVGWCYSLVGDYQQARAYCRQAVIVSAEADHRWVEGAAWDSVGYAEHHLGNLAEAAACYQRALSLYREVGERFFEAETLAHLGDTRCAAGELARARQAWQQALVILEDLQHADADQVRAKLASTDESASSSPSA